MFGITVAIFDITVVFLLDLFCIGASRNQIMERRANGNNPKKENKESKIGTKQRRKVAIRRIGPGGRS